MNTPSPSSSKMNGLLARISKSRFVTISLLLHLVLIIVGGSTVLFQVTAKSPDFEAGSEGLLVESNDHALPPETLDAGSMEPAAPELPELNAPLSAMVTASLQATPWTMNAVPDVQNVADSMQRSMAALGSKVSSGGSMGSSGFGGGGLGGAGMGRAGGTFMGMIFGKKIQAKKLGVILDVSGSAHRYLAGAVSEIHKGGFKDAMIILYPGCGMRNFDGRSGHDIRRFSSISPRNLDPNAPPSTTAGHLARALKIPAFEEMTQRPEVKDTLFVSWYEGNPKGRLNGCTQDAFEELFRKNVDAIYWFADFADQIEPPVVERLSSRLKARHVTLHVHNFAGKAIWPEVTAMAEKSGGTVNTERPSIQ